MATGSLIAEPDGEKRGEEERLAGSHWARRTAIDNALSASGGTPSANLRLLQRLNRRPSPRRHQGSISPLNLLRGRLVVYRAEVDGVDILIDREPDGTIPLLKTLVSNKGNSAAPSPPAKTGTAPVKLEPPLRIDAIRLTHVNTKLRDRSVSPPFEAAIRTTVRVSKVGSIKNGEVSADDVVGPALGAVAGVLTTAIASAPVKAVAGVGNLLGLGGPQKPAQEQTIALRFLPTLANTSSVRRAWASLLSSLCRLSDNKLTAGLALARIITFRPPGSAPSIVRDRRFTQLIP